MPSARAEEFRRVAIKLGFRKERQKGSHERWQHPDGRATTIPAHGSEAIGGRLYYAILKQLGVDEKRFKELA
jgi:predicted RNA binding protein YcfA (HicA-like mRNA interferase family)